jgi:hypothetical protein
MIENRKMEIEQLRSIATSTTIPHKDVNVKSSSDKDKMGNTVVKIVELEKETSVIISQRSKILRQIENIPDAKMYEVLYQKFVDNKPNKEIKLENITSVRRVQQILNDALAKFESMYGYQYLIS